MSNVARAYERSCDNEYEQLCRESERRELATEQAEEEGNYYSARFVSEAIGESHDSIWNAISANIEKPDAAEIGRIVIAQYKAYRAQDLESEIDRILDSKDDEDF